MPRQGKAQASERQRPPVALRAVRNRKVKIVPRAYLLAMDTVLNVSPPLFRDRPGSGKFAQGIIDAAVRFRDSYGAMPSVRCRRLAIALGEEAPNAGIAERFGFKPKLFLAEKPGSRKEAVRLLESYVIPVYEHSEKRFASVIRIACRKLGDDFTRAYAGLEGTPFVDVVHDERHREFKFMPASEILFNRFRRMHRSERVQHTWGIALCAYESVGKGKVLVTDIQREGFFRKKTAPIGPYELGSYAKREFELQNSGKELFTPPGMLEEAFYVAVAFCHAKELFLPGSRLVFDRWKPIFDAWGKRAPDSLRETDFGVYDRLGEKYGKRTDRLPDTRFTEKSKGPAVGWLIRLR